MSFDHQRPDSHSISQQFNTRYSRTLFPSFPRLWLWISAACSLQTLGHQTQHKATFLQVSVQHRQKLFTTSQEVLWVFPRIFNIQFSKGLYHVPHCVNKSTVPIQLFSI